MRTWKLSLVASLAFAAGSLAQNTAPENIPVLKPQDADAMKAWNDANKVGENQVKLALEIDGTWKATTTVWMTPDAPAATSEGQAKFGSTMGGRFVEGEFESKLFGLPFKGKQWFGYNNAAKQYESVWIDSESTGLLVTTGTRDAQNSIVWTGSTTNPLTGQKQSVKAKTSWPEKGKMVFEMWDTASDGKEFRSLQVEYVKQEVKQGGKAPGKPEIKAAENAPEVPGRKTTEQKVNPAKANPPAITKQPAPPASTPETAPATPK